MADDKSAPSGGGGWGALEIILGIVLLIGLLDRLSGKIYDTTAPNGDPSNTSEQVSGSTCGLDITSPKKMEKIRNFVTVSGTSGECDWKATADTAIYAQLIDSRGRPVSDYIKIPPQIQGVARVSFMENIYFSMPPAKGTGYLILVPAVNQDVSKTTSLRIPLNFSR